MESLTDFCCEWRGEATERRAAAARSGALFMSEASGSGSAKQSTFGDFAVWRGPLGGDPDGKPLCPRRAAHGRSRESEGVLLEAVRLEAEGHADARRRHVHHDRGR